MKWLTPLVDHDQIMHTLIAAPPSSALVLIRCGDGWQAPVIWRAAPLSPDTLGDFDAEADEIAATITGPNISPVIVLRGFKPCPATRDPMCIPAAPIPRIFSLTRMSTRSSPNWKALRGTPCATRSSSISMPTRR